MSDKDSRTAATQRSGWLPQQIALSEIQNPLLRKGLDLWAGKKGERTMPSRADLSPRDMAEFLRNIVLVKVLDGGREFEFRVVGDAIVVVQGAAFQGMTLKDIDLVLPGYGSALRVVYARVCELREPLAFRGRAQNGPEGKPFSHETLIVPLGADGQIVDHILVIGIYAFADTPGRR